MTMRIREQNSALRKEKEHLADSLADIAHQLHPLTSANLILSLLENAPDENERKKFDERNRKNYLCRWTGFDNSAENYHALTQELWFFKAYR